jgi:predicted O-methyltransferase YrrM
MNAPGARFEQLLGEAEAFLPRYLEATRGLSHANKGIRRSELFFFYALVAPLKPKRIVESGRARAQSTLVLSRLFPKASIVSLESDAHSPDVALAAERLHGCENVECLFGDSLRLLPELVQAGDVVLIDGPKDFRALKLAFRLLHGGQPAAVFVHDLWPGSPARKFVDRYLPSALLSDDRQWVERYATLDSSKSAPSFESSLRHLAYGATLGCFERETANYGRRLLQCSAAQGADRLRETARKILRRPPTVRPKDFEPRPGSTRCR